MNRGERTDQYNYGWKEYINRSNTYLLNNNRSWKKMPESRGYTVWIRGSYSELHQEFSMSHRTGRQVRKKVNLPGNTKKYNKTNPGSLLNDYWFFLRQTRRAMPTLRSTRSPG